MFFTAFPSVEVDQTDRLKAFDAYLAGRSLMRDWPTEQTLDRALEHLNEAVEIDPTYAAAHAEVCYAQLRYFTITSDEKYLRKAEAACLDASLIDDTKWEVKLAMGELLLAKGQQSGARDELQQADVLEPDNPRILGALSRLYESSGSFEQARQALERAASLEPGYWSWQESLGQLLYRNSAYKESGAALEKALTLSPPDTVKILGNLASTYYMAEEFDLAEKSWKQSLDGYETPYAYAGLGTLYADRGCPAHSARAYIKALRLRPTTKDFWGDLGDAELVDQASNEAIVLGYPENLISRDLSGEQASCKMTPISERCDEVID